MRQWKRTTALAVFACALVVLCVCSFLRRTGAVAVSSYGLIRKGMSRTEVEAIVGGPPGEYTSKPVVKYYAPTGLSLERTVAWATDDGDLTVSFLSDKVTNVSFVAHNMGPFCRLLQRVDIWLFPLVDPVTGRPLRFLDAIDELIDD